jgi:SAM-dependent methyltransferase
VKTPLLGFDENGEVFDAGDAIHRTIRAEYRERTAGLYRAYEAHGLAAKGIVETRLRDDGSLEHRKLTVSYPYEWPANMYKDAVLFHLRLFAELDRAGLTLKDALPNNILFDRTRPVFVDFLSLVAPERLKEEAWLGAGGYADARCAVLEKMLLPYLVLPLLFFARGEARIARDLLSTRSCNCAGRRPSWLELVPPPLSRRTARIGNYFRSLGIAARVVGLKTGSFPAAIAALTRAAESLDVTPRPSAYASYYDEKREAMSLADPSSFLPKQRTVHELLREKRPATVLDLGANTGWYSALAASIGADVIAVEEDEACVDILYRRARKNGLRILALKGSFAELTREIYGSPRFERAKAAPLYRAGVERLAAETVLVLGLLHHLVLGEGRTLEQVLTTLARLTKKTLVLEFVALDDEKVVTEPSFFANLYRHTPQTYNLQKLVELGRRHFARAELRPSNPATRTMVVFEK